MPEVVANRIASLFCVVCLGLCGCYTPPRPEGTIGYFQESASVDVVLLFYRWDNFFVVRPEYRDDGFLRPLAVKDLNSAFDVLQVRRQMAVVVIGWNYDPRDMKEIIAGWRSALAPHGFRRIVCLYGDDNNKLDGLPIIDDWSPPVEQPNQITKI